MDPIRLLLVDDEADFRRAIARRLTKRGITPAEAATGEECLRLLAEQPMDVVVLDVKMPGMNGIEVLGRIKEKYPETEVILLTGHATTPDGVAGIKSGAFDYLTKPIELEQLVSKIHQAHDKILRAAEKKREAAYRARMEQQMIATERLASLGTLATGVAHEINNPLAIIKESAGWMRLILKNPQMADIPRREDLEKAIGKIENAIERARRITHQLLGSVQRQEAAVVEVHLPSLVAETLELLHREIANRNVSVQREIAPEAETIWSDPYQLRQVLINLLSNAVQASADEGRIDVRLQAHGEGVALEIADTGKGIPKENLDKIFEPFFSTKPPGEGTGLGLFVTRGIVEKLGGRITVESRLGAGARFRVVLPKRHISAADNGAPSGGDDWLDQIRHLAKEP
ncbi:MAG: response regulator [Desulfobacteraceae bacterium]|nr:response regulator [Desulfobacteraceae bacterium]